MARWEATERERLEALKRLFRDHPDTDVNMRDPDYRGRTFLMRAVYNADRTIVNYLLTEFPMIDVNVRDDRGFTAFHTAINYGCRREFKLLLADKRVDLNIPDHCFFSPVERIIDKDEITLLLDWIASGRPIDTTFYTSRGRAHEKYHTVIDHFKAVYTYDPRVTMTWVEDYINDQKRTIHAARLRLGYEDEVAASHFALVVFVSDDYLTVKTEENRSIRFFRIASRLPMELQMLLCYRVTGSSSKEIIPHQCREFEFQSLAKKLLS